MNPFSEYLSLPTERDNPQTRDLDRIPLRRVLEKINAEDRMVPLAVRRVLPRMEKAARLMASAYSKGGRIIFAGAGTSGRLGVLEAAECPPTFGVPAYRVVGLMAGGRSAVFRSREGSEDDFRAGSGDLLKKARKGDVVIGIAASGITPYVLGALSAAKRSGCVTVLVTCNYRASVRSADVVISPDVGPEALSGSTRMKCGTAAKLILNSLTTSAMVMSGKVYKNRMVDLTPASRKLSARAERLISLIGRVSPLKAGEFFKLAGYDVKKAIVMARLGVSPKEASARLKKAGGFLKDVIERR